MRVRCAIRPKLFIASLFILWSLLGVHPHDAIADDTLSALARIQLLESSRRTERSKWRPLVNHANPMVRVVALRGIGRVQSMKLVSLVEAQLKHENPLVRAEATFAYGQLPGVSPQPISSLISSEKDQMVRERLVQVLGRLATTSDVAQLMQLTKDKASSVRAASLIALAELAARENGRLPGFEPSPLAAHLTDSDEAVRFGVAYILNRHPGIPDQHGLYWAEKCFKDKAAHIRALCAEALGRYGAKSKALRTQGSVDPSWRVRSAIAQAHSAAGDVEAIAQRLAAIATTLKTDTTPVMGAARHEVVALFNGALSHPTNQGVSNAAKGIFIALQGMISGGKQGDMGLSELSCAAATLVDHGRRRIQLTKTCGDRSFPPRLREPWMVRVFKGQTHTAKINSLAGLYPKLTTAGRVFVLRTLGDMAANKKSKSLVLKSLESSTPTIVGAAADACGRLGIKEAIQPLMTAYQDAYQSGKYLVVQSIFEALGELRAEQSQAILEKHTNDSQPGVRRAAQQAVKRIDQAMRSRMGRTGMGGAFVPGRRGLLPPPAEAMVGERPDLSIIKPSRFNTAIIKTKRGNIEIKLLSNLARETIKNFVRLADKGFYRGLTFHRVVANFVIQGGDPDGTGWGGPGYTIPCEVNGESFTTGTVGMALSGKDTGGSQFFITQGRVPQLDGKYTAFARVVSGQKVVDAIAPGDQILDVELR